MAELTQEQEEELILQIHDIVLQLGYGGAAIAFFDVGDCNAIHEDGTVCDGMGVTKGSSIFFEDHIPQDMRVKAIRYAIDGLIDDVKEQAKAIEAHEHVPRTLQ